jgi:hypothetical protein
MRKASGLLIYILFHHFGYAFNIFINSQCVPLDPTGLFYQLICKHHHKGAASWIFVLSLKHCPITRLTNPTSPP